MIAYSNHLFDNKDLLKGLRHWMHGQVKNFQFEEACKALDLVRTLEYLGDKEILERELNKHIY